MGKGLTYASKTPDARGQVAYDAEEHATWAILYQRQLEILPGRACPEYLDALARVGLPSDHIPQCPDLTACLRQSTGVEIVPVPALISNERFFELLASGRFPCATFIRSREELEYLEEPDVFHEVFGHVPLLSDARFADFARAYGQAGLACRNQQEQDVLARLYWYTIEFGLVQTPQGIRTYGAGVISSIGETVYAIESTTPIRRPFDALDVLRTPYRIDAFQTLYYILTGFDELFSVAKSDITGLVRRAIREGDYRETASVRGTADI
ncbi:MAG: phenylalanine 4-monooxygenase [Gammaproteobacteria bacterium]